MKTPSIDITSELNSDIKSIAKRNGMKKDEWMVWALTEMVRQVKEIEANIASRTTEENKKILEGGGLHIENSVPLYPDNLSDELKEKLGDVKAENSAMSFTEGYDIPPSEDHTLQNQEIINQVLNNPATEETPPVIQKKTIQPLEENGIASIPSYTFYMIAGGEQTVDAKTLDEAVSKLGLAEDDYLDYKVTE